MATKQLNYKGPPSVAIAAGATTPNPGIVGVEIWSSTAGAKLYWNGNSWQLSNLIHVSATQPSNPVLNQLWIQI